MSAIGIATLLNQSDPMEPMEPIEAEVELGQVEPIEPMPLPRQPSLIPPELPQRPTDRFIARQKKAGSAGGRSRSEAKRAAVRRNLAKARESRWPNRPRPAIGPAYASEPDAGPAADNGDLSDDAS